jgi:hypothetical protein
MKGYMDYIGYYQPICIIGIYILASALVHPGSHFFPSSFFSSFFGSAFFSSFFGAGGPPVPPAAAIFAFP